MPLLPILWATGGISSPVCAYCMPGWRYSPTGLLLIYRCCMLRSVIMDCFVHDIVSVVII